MTGLNLPALVLTQHVNGADGVKEQESRTWTRGRRVGFPFHQKFFMGFKDIHSPKIVGGCPDNFRDEEQPEAVRKASIHT